MDPSQFNDFFNYCMQNYQSSTNQNSQNQPYFHVSTITKQLHIQFYVKYQPPSIENFQNPQFVQMFPPPCYRPTMGISGVERSNEELESPTESMFTQFP